MNLRTRMVRKEIRGEDSEDMTGLRRGFEKNEMIKKGM